jgi:hypothetical protein
MVRAAQGRRIAFDEPIDGRVRATRAVAGILLGVFMFGQLTPQADNGRRWLWEQARPWVFGPPEKLAADASTDPEPKPPALDLAPDAVDGRADSAWSAPWPARKQIKKPEPCTRSPTSVLVVTFDGAQSVSTLVISAGLDRENADWSKEHVPKTIDVWYSDGTCHRVSLDNIGDKQTLDVPARAVTGARLTIVEAHRPETGNGGTISITDVEFQAQ